MASPRTAPRSRRSASAAPASDSTRERLIAVGTRLFAQRGIEGTSIRDIATEAEANVAAIHYHFGGKEGLYAAVVEDVFARASSIKLVLQRELELARAAGDRREAEAALKRCAAELLSRLFARDERGWPGAFLARESFEPTAAMQRVMEEFSLPAWNTFLGLLELLRPDLAGTEQLKWIASSVVGQCLYFQQSMPLVKVTFQLERFDNVFVSRAAEHVTAFSLAALGSLRT